MWEQTNKEGRKEGRKRDNVTEMSGSITGTVQMFAAFVFCQTGPHIAHFTYSHRGLKSTKFGKLAILPSLTRHPFNLLKPSGNFTYHQV
jgi:hypothetical protein